MTYYRVKPDFDGRAVLTAPGGKFVCELVKGELFTPSEMKRLGKCWIDRPYKKQAAALEKVEINRGRTFTNFGVRFEIH